MSTSPRQLHLGAFVMATGHHVAGWRHPDAHADAGRSLAHYAALARRAESAGFDALFLADVHGTYNIYQGSVYVRQELVDKIMEYKRFKEASEVMMVMEAAIAKAEPAKTAARNAKNAASIAKAAKK